MLPVDAADYNIAIKKCSLLVDKRPPPPEWLLLGTDLVLEEVWAQMPVGDMNEVEAAMGNGGGGGGGGETSFRLMRSTGSGGGDDRSRGQSYAQAGLQWLRRASPVQVLQLAARSGGVAVGPIPGGVGSSSSSSSVRGGGQARAFAFLGKSGMRFPRWRK
jgi:hypothetical protein